MNPVVKNRQARFSYAIEETFTAGIQLYGTEVKSVREGKANLSDSYCYLTCLLYTSPSPRDVEESRMPSSA